MKSAWMMSIRTKIFFGCISLTCVTIFVGLLSLTAQTKLSGTALGIYDNAFQSMSYMRSAQSIMLGLSRDIAVGERSNAIFVDQLQSAIDALELARERAMSPRGETLARKLQDSTLDLQTLFRTSAGVPTRSVFEQVEQTFDEAVSVYASDGFRLRRSAEAVVDDTRLKTYLAMLGSMVTAVLITLLVSRAIVPSIRQAVSIATAIASGNLDNPIKVQGSSETDLLLQALATMQASIAEKIGFIKELMTQQASNYDVTIASQNARFETALNHMTLGLRMFDAADVLVVQNRRFSEMFGTDDVVSALTAERPSPRMHAGDARADSVAYHRLLQDGRTIEVSEEAMAGGGRVVTYEDITERQRAEARMFHMARHDALTGLPNRVLFREHLQRETRSEQGGVLSVLCLDLDRFKSVNDTLGHPVGDELLRKAAERLLSATGPAGIVVRLGGDEFAVIHGPTAQRGTADILAMRLIEALSLPFDIDAHHISVGVSIGIAETTDGTETPDELMKNADLALYAAKAAGRGTYRVFEPDMNARVQARRGIELDLRVAVAERQFELYYQPLISARTGLVVGFEALLRWHHPKRGMVSPADFIPIAEESGLIPAIGLWVLNQACQDAVSWPSNVKVAVNLSPLQFQYRDLVGDVEDALQRSGLSPTRLDLEITESLMLQNSDSTLSALHSLRALGVGISMDDFGTGYSSLSYLRLFPFDKIKIDRSFIRDVVDDKDGLSIVKAVIRLGQSLRMNVVAEGVETIEQKNLLCEAGCQELQGYLFSQPKPAAEVQGIIGRMPLGRAA